MDRERLMVAADYLRDGGFEEEADYLLKPLAVVRRGEAFQILGGQPDPMTVICDDWVMDPPDRHRIPQLGGTIRFMIAGETV